MNTDKKFILKPGKHQFAPAEAAVHDNDNLTDKEAAWYIKRYPHIKSLFLSIPIKGEPKSAVITDSSKSKRKTKTKSAIISKEETI